MFSDVSPFSGCPDGVRRGNSEKIKYLKISPGKRARESEHKDGLQFLFHASAIFIRDPFPGSINSKSVGIYFPHRLLLFGIWIRFKLLRIDSRERAKLRF